MDERSPTENLERKIRRLSRSVAVLGVALVLLVAHAALPLGQGIAQPPPRITVQGDRVTFSPFDDGPYVVTHLAAYGTGERDKRVVALPEPLAIVDSEGGSTYMTGLKWRDIFGNPADPPPTDAKITALYYRPAWTAPSP